MTDPAYYQALVIKNPALIASMTPRATPFMRHVPFPKQAAFLLLDCEEALYGGAGGGGKGDCLLLAALQYVDVPGYAAIIFRRTFPELSLPGSMIPRAHDWLSGTGARWSEKFKRWTFPSSRATLTFGHMENEHDVEKYKSSEFHFAGFDELTTFTKYQWDYISSRTRRLKGSEIPIRKRGASNPGGVGHCVPYGEVLTPNGWIPIKEIKIGDPCYAVDENGGLVKTIVQQTHNSISDVIVLEGRSLHIAVTPEHRLAKIGGTKRKQGSKFSLVKFKDLPGQTTILRSVSWIGNPLGDISVFDPFSLRKSKRPQPKILSGENYCRLLGWFLTEGCLIDRDRAINISQTKPESRARLKMFLEEDCGFTVSWSKSGALIYSAAWWAHLKKEAFGLCRDKFIPQRVKEASHNELSAIFDAVMDGDGHWITRGKSGQFYTTSYKLADDFSEIAIKLGYVVFKSQRQRENRKGLSFCISIKISKSGGTEILTGNHVYSVSTSTKRRTKKNIISSAEVFCIGLPKHHAFIIRQKGSVWVSGNSWVKQHFLVEGAMHGRVFLPAKLSDNPYIDQEAYVQSLSHLDPVSRAQILNGDWDARFEGSLFRREWCEVVKPEHVPAGILTVRAWDRAGTKKTAHNKPDWTVGIKQGRTESGIIYLKHIVRFQGTPLENRTAIRNTAIADRGEVYEIVLPEDPGSAGKDTIDTYRREVLPDFRIFSERQTGSKLERGGAFASQCQAGNVKLVEGPWLSDYYDEMENYDGSDKKVDDQWDAGASGYNRLVTLSGTTGSAVITTGTMRRGNNIPTGRIVRDPSYERHLQVQRQLADLDEKNNSGG